MTFFAESAGPRSQALPGDALASRLCLARQSLAPCVPRQSLGTRNGYTLFELVLVLALLVVLAALAFPSVEAMYGDYRVTAAVDAVRASWASARAQAMQEARPYRFAVASSRTSFRVAPESSAYWEGNGVDKDAETDERPLVLDEFLPRGVRFGLLTNGNGAASAEGEWSSIITFLPDGTARADAELVFESRGAQSLCLKLRGFTGVASVRALPPGTGGAPW